MKPLELFFRRDYLTSDLFVPDVLAIPDYCTGNLDDIVEFNFYR